jgi:hypothetical protein
LHNASELFKKAIKQPKRELSIRATIGGTTYTGNDIKDSSIEESILTEDDFKFGSATASTFNITLINIDSSLTAKSFEGKEISIEIGVQLEKFIKPYEYAPMGVYNVEKATKDNTTIKLSGYDNMLKFEKTYVTKLKAPFTLKQALIEICSLAGVELESSTFTNCDYVITYDPDLESVTLRQALQYISELACGYANINRNGKLEIISINDTDISLNKSNYYQNKLSLSEYEYGPIDHVVINNEGIIEDIGSGSNILEIKDNIYALANSEVLLNGIYNKVKNFRFKPFTCTWQGNPLTAPGDIVEVEGKDGTVYKSFIAKQKFNYSNGLSCDITTNAKTQSEIDYQTHGTVTQKINKIKATIKNMGDAIELRVTKEENEASIKLLNDNINLKVSKGNLISEINMSPEKINASAINIDFNGFVTFNALSGSGTTTINGDNIKTGKVLAQYLDGDNLTVHKAMNLDASATIQWDTQVTNKPYIPTVPGYITSTKITQTDIESPTIKGGKFIGDEFTVNAILGLKAPESPVAGGLGQGTIRFYTNDSNYKQMGYYNTGINLNSNLLLTGPGESYYNFTAQDINAMGNINALYGTVKCKNIDCSLAPWAVKTVVDNQFSSVGSHLTNLDGYIIQLNNKIIALGGTSIF